MIKSKTDIDSFYLKYSGYLDVVAGFVEDRRLPFIIRACRLRPYSSLRKSLSKTTAFVDLWVDEYGNSIRILESKKYKTVLNDLSIARKKLECTDLYANVNIKDLVKISRLLYIGCWEDDTYDNTNKDVYFLSFLGHDNYLRTRVFIDGNWAICSALYLGIGILKKIADNLETVGFEIIEDLKAIPRVALNRSSDRNQFITIWPPPAKLTEMFKDKHPFIFNQLKMY